MDTRRDYIKRQYRQRIRRKFPKESYRNNLRDCSPAEELVFIAIKQGFTYRELLSAVTTMPQSHVGCIKAYRRSLRNYHPTKKLKKVTKPHIVTAEEEKGFSRESILEYFESRNSDEEKIPWN